jgi:hypothetical protein
VDLVEEGLDSMGDWTTISIGWTASTIDKLGDIGGKVVEVTSVEFEDGATGWTGGLIDATKE